ncbi:LOG family protein [Aliikangiella sp. G2MR2-5]|uniref:LOG family protein n=1 Tax=Aliikangiella sp. G2MR2-5 TaxID=2788943 RepID=UPI0018AAFA2F|nr:LOG family protein [Aliikangiella sp. G2MR2-5]
MSKPHLPPLDIEEEKEDQLRAERLSQEWLLVEEALDTAKIYKTIVFFGSARIEDRRTAELMQEKADKLSRDKALLSKTNKHLIDIAKQNAQLSLAQSRYYEDARTLANWLAKHLYDCNEVHTRLVTGGGPGIMEAANRGASELGQKSIGLNITIPSEQKPNPYIPAELSFQFHYFSVRKMHFLKRARAIIVFPGGFGTLDELLEVLTLIQTRKIERIPILLYGKEYWQKVINFNYLAAQHLIDKEDLTFFSVVDDLKTAQSMLLNYLQCEV